jgi:adenylate cyclase
MEFLARLVIGQTARTFFEHSDNMKAWQLSMRGRGHWLKRTHEGWQEAKRLWEEALRLQPDAALHHTHMGFLHWWTPYLGSTEEEVEKLRIARGYAEKSIEMAPQLADAHSLMALTTLHQSEHDLALDYAERTISLATADPDAMGAAGIVLYACGDGERGVVQLRKAMRLKPHTPDWMLRELGRALTTCGRYDEALDLNKQLLAESLINDGTYRFALVDTALNNGLKGNLDAAKAAITELYEVAPEWTIASYERNLARFSDRNFAAKLLEILETACRTMTR